MANRFNANPKSKFGVPPLKSGYDSNSDKPEFTLPSVGLEDADRALYNLFENEIPFQVRNSDDEMKKVPVVFAAGEKWAMLKKGAPRDKSGSLILPIIVIGRTNISQGLAEDIGGRGINQQTGEIVLKRRLDGTNRNYQSLINNLFLKNQENVAVNPSDDPTENQLTTTSPVGELRDDVDITRGALLAPKKKRSNVWETIVIPSPQFYTATYDVIIWAQYIQQMNSILEMLISSFLPQGNQWRLDTPKGYWFIAKVDGNLYNAQNNYDDMAQSERIVKYQFSIKVPAYILGSETPGAPVPIKRYVSNPEISFSINSTTGINTEDDPWLGADDPTLPHDNKTNTRDDQRQAGKTRLYPSKSTTSPHDPALESYDRTTSPVGQYRTVNYVDKKGNRVKKKIKVKTINPHSGETVYSSNTNLGGITIISVED